MKENTVNEEMLMLLKALVEKVQVLEKAVFDKDNLLMKSGWVSVETPKPNISNQETEIDNIAKMEWSEISEMMTKFDGQNRGGY